MLGLYDLYHAAKVCSHSRGAVGGAPIHPKLNPARVRNEKQVRQQPGFYVLDFANKGWEEDYIWLIRMDDGRHVLVHAGHDYTGWDCQAGGIIVYYDSWDSLRVALTPEELSLLGKD